MASHPIYEFYAELSDYTPKIWRRFQVNSGMTVARLGYILMTLFEMQASHLFRVDIPARKNFYTRMRKRLSSQEYQELLLEKPLFEENMTFEIITEDTFEFRDEDEKVYDAAIHQLKHICLDPGSTLSLIYDFGDNWTVEVTLEHIIKDKEFPGRSLPRVLEGSGYGIIEDCGGTSGLEDLAKAFKKKKGLAYDEYSTWLGVDHLDLESFDIDDMNRRLKRVPTIYTNIYENDFEPSERELDFLERRYLKR